MRIPSLALWWRFSVGTRWQAFLRWWYGIDWTPTNRDERREARRERKLRRQSRSLRVKAGRGKVGK